MCLFWGPNFRRESKDLRTLDDCYNRLSPIYGGHPVGPGRTACGYFTDRIGPWTEALHGARVDRCPKCMYPVVTGIKNLNPKELYEPRLVVGVAVDAYKVFHVKREAVPQLYLVPHWTVCGVESVDFRDLLDPIEMSKRPT